MRWPLNTAHSRAVVPFCSSSSESMHEGGSMWCEVYVW